MFLYLMFLLLPVVEIALFILIGDLIGLWQTLFLVVLTAVVGTVMVARQGQQMMARAKSAFTTEEEPDYPTAQRIMIIFSGAFLMMPGFFTDAIALLLMFPSIRINIFEYMRKITEPARLHPRFKSKFDNKSSDFAKGDVIDGEFSEVHPEDRAENSSQKQVTQQH
ncbi:FxsA family protein [uncultured Ruegeria sp.]|uniref:FxsA family protein n=1 Tax=uncultured Ruegeria sp. TaxID=259304 RepID=UPI00260FBBA5|nr:FxsA family protein [uncultured Ruegeria sp.]